MVSKTIKPVAVRLGRIILSLAAFGFAMSACVSLPGAASQAPSVRSHAPSDVTRQAAKGTVLSPSQSCPPQPPDSIRSTKTLSGDELVPSGATKLRLCRYYSDGNERTYLANSRVTANQTDIAKLRRVLDSDHLIPGNKTHSCYAVNHLDTVIAAFGYPSSKVVDVQIDMTGCDNPSNGFNKAIQLDVRPRIGLQLARTFNQLVRILGRPHIEEGFYKS